MRPYVEIEDVEFGYGEVRVLEGINLTDEFQDQFNDSSNRVSFYHHTGREFLVGFRYTY